MAIGTADVLCCPKEGGLDSEALPVWPCCGHAVLVQCARGPETKPAQSTLKYLIHPERASLRAFSVSAINSSWPSSGAPGSQSPERRPQHKHSSGSRVPWPGTAATLGSSNVTKDVTSKTPDLGQQQHCHRALCNHLQGHMLK